MKIGFKITPTLLLLLGVLLLLLSPMLINRFSDDEVPITICIGLDPVMDEVEETLWSARRNLIYENLTGDAELFADIVQKIESCDYFTERGLSEQLGVKADAFILVDSPYEKHTPGREVGYRSKDGRFTCVVYEGDDFVLVELAAAY